MSERNGTSENENRKRLDQMEDVIQSMIAMTLNEVRLSQERQLENARRHLETMEEIRELITLQREHRIDIMALFQSQKNLRDTLKPPPG